MLLGDSVVRDHRHVAAGIMITRPIVLRTAQLALRRHNTTVSEDVSIAVNLGLGADGLLAGLARR